MPLEAMPEIGTGVRGFRLSENLGAHQDPSGETWPDMGQKAGLRTRPGPGPQKPKDKMLVGIWGKLGV